MSEARKEPPRWFVKMYTEAMERANPLHDRRAPSDQIDEIRRLTMFSNVSREVKRNLDELEETIVLLVDELKKHREPQCNLDPEEVTLATRIRALREKVEAYRKEVNEEILSPEDLDHIKAAEDWTHTSDTFEGPNHVCILLEILDRLRGDIEPEEN